MQSEITIFPPPAIAYMIGLLFFKTAGIPNRNSHFITGAKISIQNENCSNCNSTKSQYGKIEL
jgi:hypothetical protein